MNENKSYCPLPWMSVSLRNNGDFRVCCNANTSPSQGILKDTDGETLNGRSSDFDEVRNSPLLKEVRQAMLKGDRHEICVRCNREDDSGVRSRRQFEGEIWNHEFGIEKAREMTRPDGTINPREVPIRYYDVRFGNLCNLKCRMCGPTDSSNWYEEHFETIGKGFTDTQGRVQLERKGPGKPTVVGENAYTWYESAKFWEQAEARMSDIRRIYVVGGEPLLIEQHYELLRKIIDSGHAKNVAIEYNSNVVQIPQRAWELWKEFEVVRIGISIDGYGKINDYIRHPSKWHFLEKNLDRLDQAEGNFDLWFATTIQALNIFYLPEFLKWKIEKDFKKINATDCLPFVSAHPLHMPAYLNMKILPPAVKQMVSEKFRKFFAEWFEPYVRNSSMAPERKDLWLRKMRQLLNGYEDMMMKEDWTHHLPEFWRRMALSDRYRGESFMGTMPEIAEPIRDFLQKAGTLPN